VVLLAKGLMRGYSGEKMVLDFNVAPAKMQQMLENLASATGQQKIPNVVFMPPKDLQSLEEKKEVAKAVFGIRCNREKEGKLNPCTTLDKASKGAEVIDTWAPVQSGKLLNAVLPHCDTVFEMPFDAPKLVDGEVQFPSQEKVDEFITDCDTFSKIRVLRKRPKEYKP
jgi:hypothetical protein